MDRFTTYLGLVIIADVTGIAVLEVPTGFEYCVLGFDHLNTRERFGESPDGFNRIFNSGVNLDFHQ